MIDDVRNATEPTRWVAPGLEQISGAQQVESGKYTFTTEACDILSVPSGPV